MSLPVDSYCIQCYLRRNADLVRPLGDEAKTTAFLKKIMTLYLNAPEWVSSPGLGPQVADLRHEMYGLELDRFRQEKLDSNRFVLERMEEIRRRVNGGENPVLAGLQYAILGNYLDFSALQGNVSYEKLDEMLDGAKNIDVAGPVFDCFVSDLAKGKKLLYLTDNAGEIGFDRVFAETIQRVYPQLEITFCVRGDVTLNDATREDAAAVGISFPVIDNGNRVAGTQMDLLSSQAKQALEQADVVLAKGMGNAETLLGCGYNVYYAFLVKCPRFVQIFNKPMFTPMLIRDDIPLPQIARGK